MFEVHRRQARSMVFDSGEDNGDEKVMFRSQGARMGQPNEVHQIGSMLDRSENKAPRSRLGKEGACPRCGAGHLGQPSDIEQIREKFAKLLLGEDMSGGGKGVSSALALSNAITNLAASVFGEQRKLEPMAPETKARWRKEIDWLLSVTDHIVEFVPSQQVGKDGINMEDVGQSVLESYSRILETLAFTVMSRIEDVLYADQVARDPSKKNSYRNLSPADSDVAPLKKLEPKEAMERLDSMEQTASFTLSDFMGWALDQDSESEKKDQHQGSLSPMEVTCLEEPKLRKPPIVATHKKFSYIEKLENFGGLRSPTARH